MRLKNAPGCIFTLMQPLSKSKAPSGPLRESWGFDMANAWFRMYSEFATDPKVQMLSEADQRRYIMILCMRCSNDGVTLHDEEVAFQLRISNDEWVSTKRTLMAKGLVTNDNKPAAWEKRQFVSDSSAERVARHRASKKQPCNVTETKSNALDTDTDTDTEDISSGSSSIPTMLTESGETKTKAVNKTIPDCPHADILALWAEKLPVAIQPADWNEKRQHALRSRWREKANRQKLDWWARFFEYIGESDFLMGRTNTPGRKAFALSLDWLCKSDNFLKVIEGRFHEQEGASA
jgi:hypothetical protein